MSVLTVPAKADLADDAPAKATFITETALTFTVANTGGIGILTVYGLLGQTITAEAVVVVAVVLGVLVTLLGTPWPDKVKGTPTTPATPATSVGQTLSTSSLEKTRVIAIQVVIGMFNTALLAVALWGSVIAIEAGLAS